VSASSEADARRALEAAIGHRFLPASEAFQRAAPIQPAQAAESPADVETVDVQGAGLHPVQESAGMDPATVKRDFGDKIVIYGSLDVIDGLLAYEGDVLEEYITQRFEIYAPGGGFIFNSGHFVQPDIPPQRLVQAYSVVNTLALRYGA